MDSYPITVEIVVKGEIEKIDNLLKDYFFYDKEPSASVYLSGGLFIDHSETSIYYYIHGISEHGMIIDSPSMVLRRYQTRTAILITGIADNQNAILQIKDLARKIIKKMGILGFELISIEPLDLKKSSALDPSERIPDNGSDKTIVKFVNDVDPSGDIPKYGTFRDLTGKKVRSIVEQCRAYQKKGATIKWYYQDILSPSDQNKFALETLKAWLKNPKFKPK